MIVEAGGSGEDKQKVSVNRKDSVSCMSDNSIIMS